MFALSVDCTRLINLDTCDSIELYKDTIICVQGGNTKILSEYETEEKAEEAYDKLIDVIGNVIET